MNLSHLDRLGRARDLVAVKGYGVTATRLTCNSGAGFDPELVDGTVADPVGQLVGLARLHS